MKWLGDAMLVAMMLGAGIWYAREAGVSWWEMVKTIGGLVAASTYIVVAVFLATGKWGE